MRYGGQNLQEMPFINRTRTRPWEFTVTRPARADPDTPVFDTFSHA